MQLAPLLCLRVTECWLFCTDAFYARSNASERFICVERSAWSLGRHIFDADFVILKLSFLLVMC